MQRPAVPPTAGGRQGPSPRPRAQGHRRGRHRPSRPKTAAGPAGCRRGRPPARPRSARRSGAGREVAITVPAASSVSGRGAEGHAEAVAFQRIGDVGDGLGRLAQRHGQNAGRVRVQRAGMAGLLRLKAPISPCSPRRSRSMPGGLVHDQPAGDRAALLACAPCGQPFGTTVPTIGPIGKPRVVAVQLGRIKPRDVAVEVQRVRQAQVIAEQAGEGVEVHRARSRSQRPRGCHRR